jgi:hypothetical protein
MRGFGMAGSVNPRLASFNPQLVPEINPKSEALRKKAEARNPKTAHRFGLRISVLRFLSALGLRPWDFKRRMSSVA